MGSEAATRFFWGDSPEEEEYYASRGVRNRQSYFASPHGRVFTQSFHPVVAEGEEIAAVKGCVFMSHGYGSDTGWLFQEIAINYATWGYAVYCADLLGHGRSDGLRCYLGDMEKVAAASLSFFLSVRADPAHAPLPAFLFGESMGGAAALLMYLRSPPGAWTGLILSAPLLAMPEEMQPSRLRLFLFGLLFGLADTWPAMPDKKMVGKSIRDRDRLRVIASNPRRYTGPPRVGTMRELARLCGYLQDSFPLVTAPFLALHGTEDGVTAPEGSTMLYDRAASADKTLIVYDGFYHSLVQGESPDNSRRVLADMRAWIDDRVARYAHHANDTS
ncbi:Caffeoylshikimate esterase [Ananas comosus]|uniref:Caffeoylshikimate esterase n=1 Tax=Ananas comosus TaxID=4615 RepID=A0A199W126_ANACO|nr:Caffeoylshikimate esterase [Ananas comosus]